MFKLIYRSKKQFLNKIFLYTKHDLHSKQEEVVQKYIRHKLPNEELEKNLNELKILILKKEQKLKQCQSENESQNIISQIENELESSKLKFYDQIKHLFQKEKDFDYEKFNYTLKNRFFFDQSFSIYPDASGGFYDLGPVGSAIQTNLINEWRNFFVLQENMFEIDCALITPECVLKASGHVAKFNDFMVKDVQTNEAFRVDHLIKAEVEKRLKESILSTDKADKMKKISHDIETAQATKEEIEKFIEEFKIRSPITGNKLGSVQPFNLMFQTSVGPSGTNKSYLRPETAQGVFVNFNNLYRFSQKKLPIQIAQVGKSFRNEINPKSGLIRQREFLMAEIEHFFDPYEKLNEYPKFLQIQDHSVPLLSNKDQESGNGLDFTNKTLKEAFENGIIKNQIVAYYLWKIYEFCKICGIKLDKMRFRQHLKNEMAHYAEDCWDLECLTSHGWIECVGIADRSCYDLTQHSKNSGIKLTAERRLKVPILVDKIQVKLKSKDIEKHFKKEAKAIIEYFGSLSDTQVINDIEPQINFNSILTIVIHGKEYQIPSKYFEIKRNKKSIEVEEFTPSIIEPSFGIGRIMHTILEHNFHVRENDTQRTYFTLPIELSPFKCSILPLLTNEKSMTEFSPLINKLSNKLNSLRIMHKIDNQSGSIGRRYARADEIAIPFAITIDFDSIKEPFTVTLRERDSCEQVIVGIDEIALVVKDLCEKRLSWKMVCEKYTRKEINELK